MKSRTLHIIGAGILGQHIAHYALQHCNYNSVAFFDDVSQIGITNQYGSIIGRTNSIESRIVSGEITNLLIGIGYKHMTVRNSFFQKFSPLVHFPNIIHPSSYVDKSVKIGKGIIILPGCYIDKGTILEDNLFFNPGVVIAHDNNINHNTFFGPGVRTSGFVSIGKNCFLGTGTCTVDNISICDNTFTGAGTVITKDILSSGTYIGNPARLIRAIPYLP